MRADNALRGTPSMGMQQPKPEPDMPELPPPIVIERAIRLNMAGEVELLQAALQRAPDNTQLRDRLVALLLELDRFDEVIALLDSHVETLDFDLCIELSKACFFSRPSDKAKSELALRASDRALKVASDDAMRARALSDHGKALVELGREDEGAEELRQAFLLDRQGMMVFKRHALQLLRHRRFAELDATTAEMVADGLVHTHLLAMRMLALAGLGQTEAARELAGLDQFVTSTTIEAPPGWPDLAAFNAQLAEEISANPGMRFERAGTASQRTWRVDTPALGSRPAVSALLEAIAEKVAQRMAALPQTGHPWLAGRPSGLELRCWSVITEADGFERWHYHPQGWMSGGYYVDVPETVTDGDSEAGCLIFGILDRDIGREAAERFGTRTVRPSPGLLSLFPSHTHHRTRPHGAAGRRICLAFDICET